MANGDDPVRVTGLDHIVLRVADPERAVRWYADVLGLEIDKLDEWRRGDVAFPSVRVNATTIIDLLQADRSGENLDHFCLVISGPLPDVADERFEVVAGPVQVSGAQGMGESIYVLDPDGNKVELRVYPDDD